MNENKIEMPPLPTEQPVQEAPQEDTWPAGTEEQLPKEIAQAQAIQKEAEEPEPVQEPVFPKQVQKKTPEISFNELKKSKIQAERERDEAYARLRELEARKYEPEEDLDINIAPDELAEGKHLSKVQKKISKLESQLREQERRAQEYAMEAKLKSQYADFDAIVNTNNIELLREQDPESAMIVDAIPNLYTKAVAAYKAIKNMTTEQKKENLYAAEKAKAQSNAAKPRPAVSINPQQADSPLSRVNAFADGLTPELQKQLLKEMHDARNR